MELAEVCAGNKPPESLDRYKQWREAGITSRVDVWSLIANGAVV